MALYKYIATRPGKSPEEIVIDGDNEKEALAKLRRRGMIPVRFLGVDNAGGRALWRGGKHSGLGVWPHHGNGCCDGSSPCFPF